MENRTRRKLQTMRLSFEEICQGEDPWIPLGNFMHSWYGGHPEHRTKMVVDPLPDPTTYPPEMHTWAAFCTASTEWFCTTYEIACPDWVHNPLYILSEPWFTEANEKMNRWLLKSTPEE